jgi:hypothetical protein
MNEWLTILAVAVGSSLLGAMASNWQSTRLERKKIVAGATMSALKRVEMYYRVRRRLPNNKEDVSLRDQFHAIQEENDHYIAQLDMEAPWLGHAYRRFLGALKRELSSFMERAWADEGGGPNIQLRSEERPDVDRFIKRFAKDGRRLFNPIMRPLMRVRFTLRKIFKEDPYES